VCKVITLGSVDTASQSGSVKRLMFVNLVDVGK
jgi:hypothetical protein